MSFILKVVQGPDAGKTLRLDPGQTYEVGCDADSDFTLRDPMVLKGHCSLIVERGAIVLRNNTASAGTFVEGKKISQARLGPNGSFSIGDSVLELGTAPKQQRRPTGPDPLVGKILGGYKMKELVGEGGMGKVYKATQLSLHRDVALKVLRDKLAKDKSFRDLFINEARAAAQLVHPNVVQVFDGGIEGEVVYFSMEFISQGSVEEILQRDTKIPWHEAILMVLEAAHGLQYAEGKGIVHRDIKPDNLMINEDGRVKIADLGLAKRGEGSGNQGIIGTPHFIPPEQALGKEVDTRADIYSLGATFFRMITGKTLFTGTTAKEIVLKHIKEPPPAASSAEKDVPDDLDLVIAKMLAKNPNQRYASATELIAALEEVCAHHGIKGSIIKKGVGKRVLIPLVLLLVAVAGFAIWKGMQDPVTIDNPEEIAKRKRAEEAAKAAAAAKEQAEREKAQLRIKGEFDAIDREELELKLINPIDSVYDDKTTESKLEQSWKALEAKYRTFAGSDAATEHGFAEKATVRADAIAKRLKEGKEVQETKGQAIDAQVKAANKADTDHRKKINDASVHRRFEAAANLCEVDPFQDIEKWVWKNPISGNQQPAMEIPRIAKVIHAGQAFYAKERSDILKQAERDWTSINAEATEITDQSESKKIEEVIAKLRAVSETYPEKAEGAKKIEEIQEYVRMAIAKRKDLEKMLRERTIARLNADRALIRDRQRRIVSLHVDNIQPNFVMNLEFAKAKSEWSRLLLNEDVQTEVYRAFVKERLAMLGYCEYLFARFQEDLAKSLASRRDGPLTTLEVTIPDFADPKARIQKRTLKVGSDPYNVALSRRYQGSFTLVLADVPLDWVYHGIFHHEGASRWKELPPVLEFALGAFAFETMQYKQARAHFEKLLGDERYGEVAKDLLARAQREQAARAEWEKICGSALDATSSAKLQDLRGQINLYAKAHAGTIFYTDVMSRGQPVTTDFFSVDYAKVPDPPPAPPHPEK